MRIAALAALVQRSGRESSAGAASVLRRRGRSPEGVDTRDA